MSSLLDPWRPCAFARTLLFYLIAAVFGAVVMTTLSVLFPPKAHAHDFWSTGEPVPPWVKAQCCGPNDVHKIPASAIHIEPDGYHIDGIKTVVPMARALPSPDGAYYGFWNPVGEPEPVIFCFFAPLNGT